MKIYCPYLFFLLFLIMVKSGIAQMPDLYRHSTCATAYYHCGRSVDIQVFSSSIKGRPVVPPTQFVRMSFSGAGNILFSSKTAGTYILYGPFNVLSPHLNNCEAIALGLVNQVSNSFTSSIQGISIAHGQGTYILALSSSTYFPINSEESKLDFTITASTYGCKDRIEDECKDCLKTFSPPPGRYVVSAWVKGESSNKNKTYLNPKISIGFNDGTSTTYSPSGSIIDEWQRIDGVLTIPSNANTMQIELSCFSGDCYFDDFRFYPLDGSVVTYTYDPVTLKLSAQLDERNFATFYEYDEEGQLIRVKKETERGVMTIQENGNNISK